MWLTLQECGIPGEIIQIIKLYDGFRCKISHEGKLSEFIEFKNGVRQGCILSPTLSLSLSLSCFFFFGCANIRQSDEKSETFKEKRNTVEYERKTGRFGLCG
jgi:hypothetical protein